MAQPRVGIIMGSYSDLDQVEPAFQVLKEMGIDFEARAMSAHRSPKEVSAWVGQLEERGFLAVIACAGVAAALPGVVAAQTILPVIGVPMRGPFLDGLDALLSIVQMPPGIPVATVGVGNTENAALLAVAIVARTDKAVAEKLHARRRFMTAKVMERDAMLQKRLNGD